MSVLRENVSWSNDTGHMGPVKAHIGGDIAITTSPTLLHWNNNNNRNFVSSFPGNVIMLIQRKTAYHIHINKCIYLFLGYNQWH